MTTREMRATYSRLFKLLRLANRTNAGEAQAALYQANRILSRLDTALNYRNHTGSTKVGFYACNLKSLRL